MKDYFKNIFIVLILKSDIKLNIITKFEYTFLIVR
jgi:hypothetical protein